MNLFKCIFTAIFLFFTATNCFGGMVTYVQTEAFLHGPGDATKQSRMLNGIHFNDDGTKLLTTYNMRPQIDGEETDFQYVHEYILSTPYDISTRTYAGDDERCELGSGSDGHNENALHDLEFSNDGMKLFTSDKTGDILFRFDLTSPYDVSTCSYVYQTDTTDTDPLQNDSKAGSDDSGDRRLQGFEINEDGTKLFVVIHGAAPRLLEYKLSTPFDFRTLSLTKTAGIPLRGVGVENPNTMRFNNDGTRIFVVSHNSNYLNVSQISLSSPYDTSNFEFDGFVKLTSISGASGLNQPRGISFNGNGLKMYIGHDSTSSIFEFDLVCPFNIIKGKCPPISANKDRAGIAEAQIEMAKRTMQYSTDSALNRLKWIRRNKERQNLTNHNINFDFSNPRIASLVKKISNSEIKDNKSDEQKDIFFWSEGSISVGKVGDNSISSAKKIGTDGITFGADKFTENKGIKGLSFRFGKDDVEVGSAGSNLDTDTFNFNYYSTSPINNDTQLLDAVLGYGRLNSDILTVVDSKKIKADRTGNQFYGALKLKDEIKKDNLTLIPSGQLDIGHTILNPYKETGDGAIDVKEQNIRTMKLRAAMAMVQDFSKKDYSFKTHGKFEYLADIDRSSIFEYKYVGDDSPGIGERLNVGALHNLNGEVGIDFVLPNSFSLFLIYERNQAIKDGHTDRLHIALGYLPNQNLNYAFKVDASDNLRSNLLVSKKLGDYKLSFDHSHDFLSEEDNYLSSINLSKDF